ncbi:hypothetical protein U0070_012308, partial [Myodes glareolus]
MTQSPSSIAVSLGEKVTIICKSSQSLFDSEYDRIVLYSANYEHSDGLFHEAITDVDTNKCDSRMFINLGSSGDIVLPNSPTSIPVSLKQRAIITCKLYALEPTEKPGQLPKFLISFASVLASVILDRFSDSGWETDITLPLHAVEGEVTANYFCQQRNELHPTAANPLTGILGVQLQKDFRQSSVQNGYAQKKLLQLHDPEASPESYGS